MMQELTPLPRGLETRIDETVTEEDIMQAILKSLRCERERFRAEIARGEAYGPDGKIIYALEQAERDPHLHPELALLANYELKQEKRQ